MDLEEDGIGKRPLSLVAFPPKPDINCFSLTCCCLVSSKWCCGCTFDPVI